MRRQAEEQVAVNPLDPSNIIAGQNDSRVGFNHCGFDYSLDGGAHWGDGQPGFFQHLNPGTLHTYDAASDPNVTFTGTGRPGTLRRVRPQHERQRPVRDSVDSCAQGSGVRQHWSRRIAVTSSPRRTTAIPSTTSSSWRATSAQVTRRRTSPSRCSSPTRSAPRATTPVRTARPRSSIRSGTGRSGRRRRTSAARARHCACSATSSTRRPIPTRATSTRGRCPSYSRTATSTSSWNNGNTPVGAPNQTLGRLIHPDGTMGPVIKVGVDDWRHQANCELGRGPEECVDSLGVRTNDFPAIAADPTNANHLVAVWQDSRNSPANDGDYGVAVAESTNGGGTWSETKYLQGSPRERRTSSRRSPSPRRARSA